MKRKVFILLSQLIIICSVYSQSGWEFQNPKPQGNDLKDLSFYDRDNGWAVGVCGMIIHTSDGGVNWDIQKSGTTKHLYSVKAFSSSIAIAAGESGTILRTTNGGQTWSEISSGTTNFIVEMFFLDQQNGFAITSFGGDLLKTTDNGLTWSKTSTGITEQANDVCFANADTGFIVCGGFFSETALYKTEDGGDTWVSQSLTTTYSLNSVFAIDTVAWIVGYDGVILKSTNKLSEWRTINAGNILTKSLYTVNFYDMNHGFAGGEMGETRVTTDGGETWNTIMSDFVQWKTVRKIQMVDSLYGYLVGDKGKMMKTTNGGLNWTHMDRRIRANLWSVWFNDVNNGIAVGDSMTSAGGWTDAKIYGTTDGGQTWKLKSTINNATLLGVHFPSDLTGYAVGFNGSKAIYAKTTDGGENWTSDVINNFGGKLWSVYFYSTTSGIAVGDSGVIMKTVDGGSTWQKKNSGTSNNLFYTCFSYNLTDAPPQDTGFTGFAVGGSGTFIKTHDLGESWDTVTTAITSSIYGISVVPRKAIWTCGSSSSIYKSVTNGIFVKQTLPVSATWVAIHAPDTSYACAVASYGGLVTTTDGGTTWTQHKFTLNTFNALHFEDKNEGWLVGEAGTIIHTSTGGMQGIRENSIVQDLNILLEQNYPNPFSNTTQIVFSVAKESPVDINIYDMYGKEVKTLLSTIVRPGKYQITFNAGELPNGIYFYELHSGAYSSVKKMIIQK